jgi:Carboxypeptidase regulatory-like domain
MIVRIVRSLNQSGTAGRRSSRAIATYNCKMKTILFSLAAVTAFLLISFGTAIPARAQRPFSNQSGTGWKSVDDQLNEKYFGRAVVRGSRLEKLIRDNQDFTLLREDEKTDKRNLPAWLRVYWRKNHPELTYSAEDPTGGYPLVLKEILEWMTSHQDLRPGPGLSEADSDAGESVVGANTRVSGLQSAARSESDIRINYFDSQKVLSASNNISASGRQGVYYSTDAGAVWSQTTLPLTTGDSFHSDPTVDWTNDGRGWSSTLGINSAGSVLKLRNYVSADNGATWTLDATVSGSQTAVDKQMVWVDHSASSPYFGQMYAIWHNNNPAFMNRRTAGSSGTWLAAPIQVSGAESTGTCIGGDVKTNSAGDVFGFWPTTTNRKIMVVKSTNGGASFGTPVQVTTTFDGYDTGIPAMNSRRALIYVSGGAFKTATKNLVYASWTDLSGDAGCTAAANEPGSNVASTCKMRVWFARSTDGGATWSAPSKINNQSSNNDQFSQWMAVDETTGKIGIIYYDTVGDAGRKKTDIWYQSSVDDGATWSAAEKVTTAMTDETISGADSGNQYGDYNSLSGFAGTFFPVWTDRRNASKEEVWTAKITAPTAASVSLSGRVTSTIDNGVSKAEVTLVDTASGTTRYVLTNPFGYYNFDDVPVGQTYLVSVSHKQYQFTPQILTLLDGAGNVNFSPAAGVLRSRSR